ncbi:MerR family transcriptional regulator [Nonomuraea phyllanthi]|uniref:MerR family transcriptional regulator n=1 Tax=Nonomuraea phyllanthi TaxID=2219224 RepID=A0A5C4WVZ0_9ACTN|nr:MerR family transcriptional regulator [Nonomuraea phyllanthi]KAB8197768.1 MerR family transcriptional regulator [Nonomuraea phyllanthi]QFY06257.1 MerR family transcriptional regulator [Nonomuraea phyllanthi]
MFSIGDFARLGLVSVRMLRHYDAIGLLRPAHVDPVTGYRSYQAAQLSRLNRIVAIKDLGFTLEQVRAILDEKVSAEELHGMVRLRRAQLEAQISADLARLRGVEARLRTIEREGHMRTAEVVLKSLGPVRVAQLAARAASYEGEHIGPVIQPLFREVCRRVEAASLRVTGPGIAYYEEEGDGSVMVHACLPVAVGDGDVGDVEVVDLPRVETAATIIHHGSMEQVGPTFQALAHWIEENGYRSSGLAREVSLHCPDNLDEWVTELQIEVTAT